jgi:hypothetical protein
VTTNPRDPFQPAPADSPAMSTLEPVVVRPRRSGAGMLVNVLLGAALVVAVGGVAFAAGRATAPAAASAAGRTGFGQGGAGAGPGASGAPARGGGFGGAGGAGGAVSIQGTVEAIDGSSMTIKLPSGTTVTIGLNGATTYHSQAPATASDVSSGSTVIVQLAGRGGPAASGAPAPAASGAPAGGLGTAGSVTVVPTGG